MPSGIKTITMEKKCKKAKWLSGEVLQIAVRSYPASEVRVCSREEIPYALLSQRPGAAGGRSYPTPRRPRPGVVAGRTNLTPEARGGGREDQPHAGCAGTGVPRGTIPR